MKRTIIFIALLALGGCAQQQLQSARQSVAGQPLSYQDGYVDGCNTGYKAAGNPYFHFAKDAMRFDKDKLYAQGWTDGFNTCKGDYEYTSHILDR